MSTELQQRLFRDQLSQLPDELLQLIAKRLLAASLPSALRLCAASRALRARLAAIEFSAGERRLRWLAAPFTRRLQVRGLTLHLPHPGSGARAACTALPSQGRFSWRLRVIHLRRRMSDMLIGVCSERGDLAWFVSSSGKLGAAVQLSLPMPPVWTGRTCSGSNGCTFPGHSRTSAVIDVCFEASGGALSIVIDGGEPVHALSGLPTGVPMRPWVSMSVPHDRISIAPFLDVQDT